MQTTTNWINSNYKPVAWYWLTLNKLFLTHTFTHSACINAFTIALGLELGNCELVLYRSKTGEGAPGFGEEVRPTLGYGPDCASSSSWL